MIGLEEMVLRAERSPFAGRSYRLGSRIRLHDGRVVTVTDCGQECDFPVFDFVDQSGAEFWAWDSQIVEVVLL